MNRNKKILLVDDDKEFSHNLASILAENNYHSDISNTFESAVERIKNNSYDVYILDIDLNSQTDGFYLGDIIKNKTPKASIIIISNSKGNIPIIKTLEHKFDHFFTKSIGYRELVKKIIEIFKTDLVPSSKNIVTDFEKFGIITQNKKMLNVLIQAANLKNSSNILIEGESGTGKELVAIYLGSILAPNGPFVTVNCPAIPESLMESVLFGHVKGSFTGADRDAVGKFEEAKNGVIFLDEISSASVSLQKKLLRVIQNQEIEKIGSSKIIKCNVKVIAATNEDLQAKVSKNEFREDLFFRLKRHTIPILPLRDRIEDIEPLITYFAKDKKSKFTQEVIVVLENYSWPGNVRELENFVYDLLIKTENKNKIILKDVLHLLTSCALESNVNLLGADITEKQIIDYLVKKSEKYGLLDYLKSLEKQIINTEFNLCKNLSECSHKLKLDPSGLSKRIKKYKQY